MSNEGGSANMASSTRPREQLGEAGSTTGNSASRLKSSVYELERIATGLRRDGEHRESETIDLKIMSLLERKIFRKVVARSRRERRDPQQSVRHWT